MTGEEKTENQIPSGTEPEQSEHFYLCTVCSQSVDRREAAQILHHMQSEHRPLVNVGLWVIASG